MKYIILTLSMLSFFTVTANAGRPIAKKGSRGMHPSVDATAPFTKKEDVLGFTVEGVHVGMSHAKVKAILKANGWKQLDLDEQNYGLLFYKGERRTDNAPEHSLIAKPGTTIYKFRYRIAGDTTSLSYERQFAAVSVMQRGAPKPSYEGPIPDDALELSYVKDLRDLVCAGYTDKILIDRYCNKPDTDQRVGFPTSKTVPVFRSMREKLSVRAVSQKMGGEVNIIYYKKSK